MPHQLTAVAFDLDGASLTSLREALPEWSIEVVNGATASSLATSWNPGVADLLVVRARDDVAQTLGLCRFLVQCRVFSNDFREQLVPSVGLRGAAQGEALRADAPLLVLVPSRQGSLVRAVLETGADGCLVLPIDAKEVVSMLARVRQGNEPGRHTLDLECAQTEDRWRDDGGQG